MKNLTDNWFQKLNNSTTDLAEQFDLDNVQADTLRSFVIDVARDQYKLGNRCGARWMKKQILKEHEVVEVKSS